MLNKDFKEFIQLLNENDVRYLVVGGYAVAFHGYPRYTEDIDIWIESNPANAKRIVKTLHEFGFGSLGLKKEDFLDPDTIFNWDTLPIVLTSLRRFQAQNLSNAIVFAKQNS